MSNDSSKDFQQNKDIYSGLTPKALLSLQLLFCSVSFFFFFKRLIILCTDMTLEYSGKIDTSLIRNVSTFPLLKLYYIQSCRKKIHLDKCTSEHMINEKPRTNVNASLSREWVWWAYLMFAFFLISWDLDIIVYKSFLLLGYCNSNCSVIELGIIYLVYD